MDEVQVLKLNPAGEVTWQYGGRVVHRSGSRVVLEAFFDREDTTLHGMRMAKGDRFIETYYTDRWYNVFEIHAREGDHLRGWYCNIGCPAEIQDGTISYIDLALDLLVFPDGRQLVLDEEEFLTLDISDGVRRQALEALAELQSGFREAAEGFLYRG